MFSLRLPYLEQIQIQEWLRMLFSTVLLWAQLELMEIVWLLGNDFFNSAQPKYLKSIWNNYRLYLARVTNLTYPIHTHATCSSSNLIHLPPHLHSV